MPALSSHPLPPLHFPERSRGIRVTPIAPATESVPQSSLRPTPTPRMPPLLAGRYTIDRYLDKGGTSRVYLGWDELCEDDVVIKVLTDDAAACSVLRGHFLVGSRAALAVQHENVVRVLAVREPDIGSPYMIMEVLKGELLADLLERKSQLSTRATLSVAAQTAAGLMALHAAGIIHCDIKPDNLYLTSAPGVAKRIKILDFGLAEVAGKTETSETPAVRGTAQFMAPEQVLGDPVDARTDVYALGVVMFRMLTGQLPFDLRLSTTLLRHQLRSATPPPSWLCDDLEPSVDAIVLKAMRKNPDNRYTSARELLADLERVSNGGSLDLAREVPADDRYTPRTRQAERAAEMLGAR